VRVSPCGNPRIPRASLLSALRDRRVLRHGVLRHPRYSLGCLVEPPLGCPKPNFESGAFDHSAISPEGKLYRVCQG